MRDTETVPFKEDIEEYFKREVLKFIPDAWIDYKKTKVGYEIPMNRFFYEYMVPEGTEIILERLERLESDIQKSLQTLFGNEVK